MIPNHTDGRQTFHPETVQIQMKNSPHFSWKNVGGGEKNSVFQEKNNKNKY